MRREARISGESRAGVSVESAVGERDHPPDLVRELADVAGPVVEHQVLEHFVGDRQVAFLLFVADPPQVVLDQWRNLLAAFAERRNCEADHVQAVEEILAEAAFGDEAFDVGVRRGDDADVDLDRVRLAERMDLAAYRGSAAAWAGARGSARRSRRGTACRPQPRESLPARRCRRR